MSLRQIRFFIALSLRVTQTSIFWRAFSHTNTSHYVFSAWWMPHAPQKDHNHISGTQNCYFHTVLLCSSGWRNYLLQHSFTRHTRHHRYMDPRTTFDQLIAHPFAGSRFIESFGGHRRLPPPPSHQPQESSARLTKKIRKRPVGEVFAGIRHPTPETRPPRQPVSIGLTKYRTPGGRRRPWFELGASAWYVLFPSLSWSHRETISKHLLTAAQTRLVTERHETKHCVYA